jgi:hypothetical protein
VILSFLLFNLFQFALNVADISLPNTAYNALFDVITGSVCKITLEFGFSDHQIN